MHSHNHSRTHLLLSWLEDRTTPAFVFSEALQIGGAGDEYVTDTATDADGNLFILGTFDETVDFDPGPGVFERSPMVAGRGSTFLVKLNAQDELVWVRTWESGQSYDTFSFDLNKNIYVLGQLQSDFSDVDPGVGAHILNPGGTFDGVIVQLNSEGLFESAHVFESFDPVGVVNLSHIQVDRLRNMYITGDYYGSMDPNPSPTDTTLLPAVPEGRCDFILKLDAMGRLQWVNQLPERDGFLEIDPLEIEDLCIDSFSRPVMALRYDGTLSMNGVDLLTTVDNEDGAVLILNPDGTLHWVTQVGGSKDDHVDWVTPAENGAIIVAGELYGEHDIDPDPAIVDSVMFNNRQGYIARIEADQTLGWVNYFQGGTLSSFVASIEVTESGDVVSRVLTRGTGTFGSEQTPIGYDAGYSYTKIRLDHNGNLVRMDESRDLGWDLWWRESWDELGKGTYVTARTFGGDEENRIDVDPGPNETIISSHGGFDIVLARFTNIVTVGVAPSVDQPLPELNQAIFQVQFSDPVSDFGPEDIILEGSADPTMVEIVGEGTDYTITVSGMTMSGTISMRVPAGAVLSADGSTNTASNDELNTLQFVYTEPEPPPPPPSTDDHVVVVGSGAGIVGQVIVYETDGRVRQTLEPFPGFTGGVRVACGDVNGDGFMDIIVGTGPGRSTLLRVLNGKDFSELYSMAPFEDSFTGGIYVAAGDINGDGLADILITPDEGGGPRVRILAGGNFAQITDFFGIDDSNFRGGARAAIGDVTGDGIGDLLVAAGFGGGPRLAVFEGTSVNSGQPVKPFPDFFIFEQSLRNGVFIGAGDLNGDGFADVVAGGGPGGGPRVLALSGQSLMNGSSQPVANFFAGNASNRGGVRITVEDLDDDNHAEIIAGAGQSGGTHVSIYEGESLPDNGPPSELRGFEPMPGFTNGVYVG